MSSNAPSPATERQAGIEWMRGIAAFGVICIHAGLAVHNRTTPTAGALLPDLFSFAVPFFLMTSFFFALRAEAGPWLPWRDWMHRRAGRLLIPFAFWSAVYLALHVGKLALHHQGDQIKALFKDPAVLVLSGGTSVALYFLPLVFTGLFIIHSLSGALKRLPSLTLALGFVVALALYELWWCQGNAFDLDSPNLSQAPLKLALGFLEFGLRCLPLVLAAALLTRHLPSPATQNAYAFIFAGAIFLVVAHYICPPAGVRDSVLGVGAFLLAWGLCGLLPASKWAITVGLFSFGVYLVHQVYLELIQLVFPYRAPSGAIIILAITSTVFIASMLTVSLANRGGWLMRSIFGIK